MKNKIRAFLTAVLIGAVLLTGCNLSGLGKPSVMSLTSAAIKNLEKVGSAQVQIQTDGDISAVYEALNIGMNIGLDSDTEIEMTKEPGRSKGTTAITVGAVGQEQTINGKFYKDRSEDGSTTYVKWRDGSWMKKTTVSAQATDDEEEENKDGVITMPESLIQTAGILKYISDGSITAELKEETVQVNDKEAYQITGAISGDLLKQLVESGKVNLGGIDLNSVEVDWANISVPTDIYIYKESKLPARITMDCTAIGSQIIGNMLKDDLAEFPIGEIRLDVNKFIVDITIDRYDEIEAFELPAETVEAAESENLMPDLTDLFSF